jgi:hypothetical protein
MNSIIVMPLGLLTGKLYIYEDIRTQRKLHSQAIMAALLIIPFSPENKMLKMDNSSVHVNLWAKELVKLICHPCGSSSRDLNL